MLLMAPTMTDLFSRATAGCYGARLFLSGGPGKYPPVGPICRLGVENLVKAGGGSGTLQIGADLTANDTEHVGPCLLEGPGPRDYSFGEANDAGTGHGELAPA